MKLKGWIKAVTLAYWENYDVIEDHSMSEKKEKDEISMFVYNCSMARHVRNVCNTEDLGMVRKVSNERLR